MARTISPGLEAIRLLLEAADLAKTGELDSAATLAGISANLSEYGMQVVDIEADLDSDVDN